MKPCVDNLYHYEVLSPEMGAVQPVTDDGEGPMEYWCDWVMVLATNKRDAMIQAIKHPDFKEWRQEARDANINPFSGVKATLALCEHGVCWGCADEEGINCDECRSGEPRE
jgi:hypothetical protein